MNAFITSPQELAETLHSATPTPPISLVHDDARIATQLAALAEDMSEGNLTRESGMMAVSQVGGKIRVHLNITLTPRL